MTARKKNPFADFERLSSEIEEMFYRFYGGPRLRMMKGGAFQPLADVYYLKKENVVIAKLEIPGISPEEVNITLQDKTLIVEGSRFDPQQEGEKVYQQMEIDYGPFKRKIMLPVNVDVAGSKAEYKDGFLTLELPVAEQKKSAIKVPISVKDKK
ncbi:MAG: Hsp20/alpha crystallin family protein [Actinobacteria bacterium]|nr:Hsp20/alpha crystallin family protein [Actinomycetota bacterium]